VFGGRKGFVGAAEISSSSCSSSLLTLIYIHTHTHTHTHTQVMNLLIRYHFWSFGLSHWLPKAPLDLTREQYIPGVCVCV
jgi:hypothetical protein